MATDPRKLLASQFNTGIVPVQRAQPAVNDGGEAARLAAARVNQMPPLTMDRSQIVPTGMGGGAPRVMQNMRTMNPNLATGVTAPIQEMNKANGIQRAMEAMGPERAEQFEQRRAEHDARKAERLAARQLRRESRAARIAEIMANRPNLGANNGLLAQGGLPFPRRG